MAHEGRSDGQRRGRRRCAPHVRPHAHPWATEEATIKPASPASAKPAVVRNSTTSWAARATVATAPPAAVVVVASLATPPAAAMVPAACAPLLLIPRGVVPTAAAAAGAPAPSRLVAAVVRPGAAVPGRVGRVRHGLERATYHTATESIAQTNKGTNKRRVKGTILIIGGGRGGEGKERSDR